MEEYQIIRNSESHYPAIKQLYIRASGFKKNIDFIYSKYNTISFGEKNIGYLAYRDSFPAAYYGVFPLVLVQNENEYLAAQSGDTMTDPEHQKKGLFIKLATATYLLAKECKIAFVFGFPNANSFPGFEKKLNWKFYGSMYEFSIITSQLPFAEVSKRFNIAIESYQKLVHKKLERYIIDSCEENLKCFNFQVNVLKVKKDIHFFNYKKYSSNYLIKFLGFTLFVKVDGHLIIGDVGHFQEEKLNDFIFALKYLARKLFCRKIKIYLSEGHWLYPFLATNIKSKVNNPIGILALNEVLTIDQIAFSAADFDTF